MLYRYSCKQSTHVHKIKIIKSLKRERNTEGTVCPGQQRWETPAYCQRCEEFQTHRTAPARSHPSSCLQRPLLPRPRCLGDSRWCGSRKAAREKAEAAGEGKAMTGKGTQASGPAQCSCEGGGHSIPTKPSQPGEVQAWDLESLSQKPT